MSDYAFNGDADARWWKKAFWSLLGYEDANNNGIPEAFEDNDAPNPGAEVLSNWILLGGAWDDTGVWEDTATWSDS